MNVSCPHRLDRFLSDAVKGYHCVAQADLKLLDSSDPPGSQSAGITAPIKEKLYPASFWKRHLLVHESSHAAATAGGPVWRGWASSSREPPEHVLGWQPLQEASE
ncbi:hypothetical protein AAY473_023223 [Plecturocebus cupreus]